MENEDVKIEFTATHLTVIVDGLSCCLTGEAEVLDVKRVVARQLLHAMISVPEEKRRRAEQEKYLIAQGNQANEGLGVGAPIGGAYDPNLQRAMQADRSNRRYP